MPPGGGGDGFANGAPEEGAVVRGDDEEGTGAGVNPAGRTKPGKGLTVGPDLLSPLYILYCPFFLRRQLNCFSSK